MNSVLADFVNSVVVDFVNGVFVLVGATAVHDVFLERVSFVNSVVDFVNSAFVLVGAPL